MPPEIALPASPIAGLATVELRAGSEALLQAFFVANSLYFETVNGEPAQPGEAHAEIHGELPAGWPFTKKWVIGYRDESGALAAMANVVSDLLAAGVWHVGTFIVATDRHGSGDAQALYRALEAWAVENGARWMRLGVVAGNGRAERFWERLGYGEVRRREGIAMGRRTNAIRVMAKPLRGQPLDAYLALVDRDRPDPGKAC
jgi:GNAT superfamily N-acetyltransferase